MRCFLLVSHTFADLLGRKRFRYKILLCLQALRAVNALKARCTWHRNAGRRLRDTQLNSVETHLAVGDVLAYDVSLGIASTAKTDQATGSHTNATTVAISQAAGLNNASCLMTACAIPTAGSTASTSTVTGQCRLQHLIAPYSQLDAMNQQCLIASC
jgi:hypothetical protein